MTAPVSSVSLTRHLIEGERPERIGADVRRLIEVVARACDGISAAVRKGALGGVPGDAGTPAAMCVNAQGAAQNSFDQNGCA